MPGFIWAIVDPPKEVVLRLIANSIPDRALALSGQSVDDFEDEFYLSIFISVKLIAITDTADAVEAAEIGEGVPHLRKYHNDVIARCILEKT